MPWACAIAACEERFDDVEDLLVHQADEHDPIACAVCDTSLPDGMPAIRHMMDEHGRADYVRSYGATPTDIRRREELLEYLTETVDEDVWSRLEA